MARDKSPEQLQFLEWWRGIMRHQKEIAEVARLWPPVILVRCSELRLDGFPTEIAGDDSSAKCVWKEYREYDKNENRYWYSPLHGDLLRDVANFRFCPICGVAFTIDKE